MNVGYEYDAALNADEYGRSTESCVSEPIAAIRRIIGPTAVVFVKTNSEPVPTVLKSAGLVLAVASAAEP